MDRAPILEYLSQSNDNADLVSVDDRFKFVDDLSVLEIVDLLTVGLTSYNLKLNVHNQYIPANNLKSQTWLEGINQWTFNQKMLINENEVLGLLKMILRISTGSFRINDNFVPSVDDQAVSLSDDGTTIIIDFFSFLFFLLVRVSMIRRLAYQTMVPL